MRTERLDMLWTLLAGSTSGITKASTKDREGGERALTSITRNLPDEGSRAFDVARALLSAPMSASEAKLMRRQMDTIDAATAEPHTFHNLPPINRHATPGAPLASAPPAVLEPAAHAAAPGSTAGATAGSTAGFAEGAAAPAAREEPKPERMDVDSTPSAADAPAGAPAATDAAAAAVEGASAPASAHDATGGMPPNATQGNAALSLPAARAADAAGGSSNAKLASGDVGEMAGTSQRQMSAETDDRLLAFQVRLRDRTSRLRDRTSRLAAPGRARPRRVSPHALSPDGHLTAAPSHPPPRHLGSPRVTSAHLAPATRRPAAPRSATPRRRRTTPSA